MERRLSASGCSTIDVIDDMTKEGSSSQVSVGAGVYGGSIRVNLLQAGRRGQDRSPKKNRLT